MFLHKCTYLPRDIIDLYKKQPAHCSRQGCSYQIHTATRTRLTTTEFGLFFSAQHASIQFLGHVCPVGSACIGSGEPGVLFHLVPNIHHGAEG